jgi:glycosyltransferase involved in cell wall biosynthesis
MPLALIEAQMAGVPVVSTDVGSVSEIVVDGVTGRLGSTSADDLAAKLREVIAEIGKSDAMSHAAKKQASEEFSSEVMAQTHADLYRKVLNQGIR